LSSKTLQSAFTVPGNVSPGASFCVRVYFGEDHRDAYFNPLGAKDLFCVTKLSSGAFQSLSGKASIKLFEQLNRRQLRGK
jgi:hypothetical protein